MWFAGTWNESVIYVAVVLGWTNWDCHHRSNGDSNTSSFSQAVFFIIAANVFYRRKLVSLQALVCLGQPQVQVPKQGWGSSGPQLFCIPPTAGDHLQRPLFLTPLLFKTLPLLCCSPCSLLCIWSLFSEVTQSIQEVIQVGCAVDSGPLP